MILSSYLNYADRDQTVLSSRSLTDFMSSVSIAEYNNDYKFTTLMGLTSPHNPNFIRRYDNTIADQIAEFYYREQQPPFPENPDGIPRGASFSGGLAREVIESTIPQQFEATLILSDYMTGESSVIYARNEDPRFTENEAELIVPYKSIVMGDFKHNETQQLVSWGPYVLEVRVWQ